MAAPQTKKERENMDDTIAIATTETHDHLLRFAVKDKQSRSSLHSHFLSVWAADEQQLSLHLLTDGT